MKKLICNNRVLVKRELSLVFVEELVKENTIFLIHVYFGVHMFKFQWKTIFVDINIREL